ncbi:GNAT family N-acetyltransferase [Devosia sp. YIM 151766]|uniref:GNAT family N-acetyltransferase n=1 Tax=Devosia sp. YIM 151766 TaxID=3017325 RepID=UPI00255D12E4|nr:GNAT family N-acetyltransferase [Devosia sp. YIM 151766]WIY54286.1 GNAT family N-acetyltransferase [Devosia sp. YIM 151766]
MPDIPIIRTDRLILRPPLIADYPAFEALMASPRAAYMGGPFDQRGAWGMFCHGVALWRLHGHGSLMVELAETGTCIGEIGINDGPLFPEKELGWLLYEGYEGRGYATEAAMAMRDWAFAALHLTSLVSYVDQRNMASIRVAERLGGVRDDHAERQDPADIVFRYRPV